MEKHYEINCVVAFDADGEKFLAGSPDGIVHHVEVDLSTPVTVDRCRDILAKVCEISRRDVAEIHILHSIYGGPDEKSPLVYSRRWDFDGRTGELIHRVYDNRN